MQPVVPRLRRHVIVSTVSGVAALLALAAGAPSGSFAQEVVPRPVPAALGAVDGPAAADPSELFLRAFTSVQQAETAERDGKLKLAMSKYRFAATLLDQIGQSHPNWQPLIVGYRARKTSDSITKLQNKIEVQAAASVAPPALPVTPDYPPASSAPLPPMPPSSGNNRGPDNSTGSGGGYFALPEADRAGDTGPAGGRPPVDPVPETPRVSARAEAALNKAAQDARAKIDRLQDELKNTRKQLDAAQKEREKAQEERSVAQKEQTRLQEQLQETQGDLKTANKKADDTKADRDVLEIERQKLLGRLKEDGAKTAESAATTRRELGREVEKLNERLAKADESAKAASRERDTLAAKYAATKSEVPKEITERLEKLAAENATLTQGRKTLETEREKLQARLQEAGAKNVELTAAARKELRQEVDKLNERLAKADEAAKTAGRERDNLAAKYAAVTKKNPAGAKGELPKEVTDRLEALAVENSALTQKLVLAERTIADLNAEAVRRKEEAEAVQGELTKLRQQLADSRDKNDQADTQIVALRKQLDEGAERMKEGLPREEANKLAKENELLRNISLKLLKQQNVRTQASKLLGEELARLEIQSRNVTEQLSVLGQPTVQLSDEERALFKDPLVAISDNADPTTLAASITAVNPVRPDGTPPVAPTAASSPSADAGNTPPLAAASPEFNAASVAAGAPPRPNAETTPPPTPPVPEALVPLAKEAKENLDQGRFAEAEAAYEKLVARAPKSVYGLANLGVVLSRQGKLKSAETKLKKAVALAPNDPFSQATLGIVYYQMRRFDDAIECLTKAISLDPKTASAHNYLGITSFQKGWPEAAVEELDKALALRPDYADAHFNLAVVYALNQPPSKEKALMHYKRATELGAAPDPALEKMIN